MADLGLWPRHHLPSLEATTWEQGFSAELEAEAQRLLSLVATDCAGDQHRLDLTHLHLFTIDDDDTVAPDYVASLVAAIKIAITPTASPTDQVDVITFEQFARVDDAQAKIVFRLRQQNQPFVPNTEVQRAAWHVCAWRRSVAILSHFPESNYGEDWAFAEPLNRIARASIHLDKVLHYYRFNSATTAAPYPDL
jgi:hypothetical protein